jgi:hypothetical protein
MDTQLRTSEVKIYEERNAGRIVYGLKNVDETSCKNNGHLKCYAYLIKTL